MAENGSKTDAEVLRDDGGRFVAGTAPGPGRPRGVSLRDRLAAILDQQINGKTVAEHLVKVAVERALSGDARFMEMVWSRVEGKVADRVVDQGPAPGWNAPLDQIRN